MARKKLQYKHYLLVLLTIVAAFNYLDRGALSLMVEPIKADLELSDTQIGFLNGLAFALFYAIAGIPIGRWADRGNRNHVVTMTTALWSSMVALSAFVGNFIHLLLVRIGVAVGEAGCLPAGQSLISDYFERAERPKAMSIYWMSSPLSYIVAFLCGGWLVAAVGWRMTFLLIGLPGVAVAILVKFTLKEPRLNHLRRVVCEQPKFSSLLTLLWRRHAFRHVGFALCIIMFFGEGIGLWLPAFFMRSHDMSISQVGLWFALTTGVAGMSGAFLGGHLASRYAAARESVQMRFVAISLVLCTIFFVCCYLSPNKYLALSLMAATILMVTMCYGPVFSALQSLMRERERSASMAVIYLFSNLIGMGLGPFFAGVLSDLLTPFFGVEALRYTLVLLSPGYLWCAWHFWTASKTIDDDIRIVESGSITEVVENSSPGLCAVK